MSNRLILTAPFCIFHFSFIFFFLWEILDHELPKFRNHLVHIKNICAITRNVLACFYYSIELSFVQEEGVQKNALKSKRKKGTAAFAAAPATFHINL